MKKLFIICSLILAAAFFIRCEKESIFLPENESDQSIGKEKLSAITPLDTPAGELYALNPWSTQDNIAVFSYDPATDDLVLNEGFGSTGKVANFGFDFNNQDGLIYLLAGDDRFNRYLYTWNKETNEITLIEQIISVEGDYYPIDLTFGNDGTLYFVFNSGEINSYNVTTNMMSAFSTITSDYFGGVGLTYNFDSNQLVCGKTYSYESPTVELFSIEIPTGNVTALFNFNPPDNSLSMSQALEYVGNDKLLGSGTYNNDAIYSVDLVTQQANVLLSPTGIFINIKDLMFIIPNSDIDGDGVLNIDDNCPYTTNADQLDTDADGVGDACDECPGSDDSLDTDSDGVPDGCDVCVGFDDTIDVDGDGVPDGCDNCPLTANADQADTDADGVGDGCDVCPGSDDSLDTDVDGVPDGCDVCPGSDDSLDTDDDGIPNDCDNCPLTANANQADTDADGVGDVCDNCPETSNTDQADNDADSVGDVCDTDDDNDTVPDVVDNCPLTSNSDQANNDSDSEGDVCDTDDDNDSVPDVADNCPFTSNSNQANNDGDIYGDVCDSDDDNDGVPDNEDNCYLTANSDQTDTDNDGLGDVCDTDDDDDGCIDTEDLFDFSNFEATVNIEGCDTGVENRATGVCGIMMSDRIDELEGVTYTKKVTFIKAITKLTTDWQRGGLITIAEKNLILKCARKASY